MKFKITVLVLVVSMLLISQNSIGQSQTNITDNQIIAMLKKFYTDYITAGDYYANPDGLEDKEILIRDRYCSKKLLKLIYSGDYIIDDDPFVKANGGNDVKWLKTLKIHRESETKNIFNVSFLDYRNEYVSIHLTVIKENGSFKIDDVY